MSDDEDEYEYDSYDEDEQEDEKNNSEDEGKVNESKSETKKDDKSQGHNKKSIMNCKDGEVLLLHMSEIVGPMKFKISQIADLLDLPAASAAALLRYSSWSQEKLTDLFWSNSEKLLTASGINTWKKSSKVSSLGTSELSSSSSSSSTAAGAQEGSDVGGLQSSRDDSFNFALGLPVGYHGVAMISPKECESTLITCRICFSEVEQHEATASPCGHFFCNLCYQEYLQTKLGEGPSVVYTSCPEHKCNCLIPPEVWLRALAEDTNSPTLGTQAEAPGGGGGIEISDQGRQMLEKYSRMILEQFVSSNKQMRWCPAPGCDRIVMAGAGISNVRCGPGGCGNAFCFKCGEEAHQPASCEDIMLWTEKCQNESETANWILANTKRCPKCTTRIEKNQGCNHMHCSQCKHEFCWMCMGSWSEHGANTGGYYKCNKFDPTAEVDTDDAAGRAKRELDRYLHYFKRYQAHHVAQLFAEKLLIQTEKKMSDLQESTGGSSWIDVQFLKTSNEMVIECRRTLKYTYVFGFYLTSPKNMEIMKNSKHRDLFENMQEDLERYTEVVSELTEMPIEKMTTDNNKASIINNTRVVEKFLVNLLAGCDEGLDEIGKGASEMSVDKDSTKSIPESSSSSSSSSKK